MRYRYKTHEVEAFQWPEGKPFPKDTPEWFQKLVADKQVDFQRDDLVVIYPRSRVIKVRPSYYVVRFQRTNQEVTSMDADQFQYHYEPAT